MKVFHILEDYSLKSGGIRTVVQDIRNHVPLTHQVVTTCKEGSDDAIYFKSQNSWQYSNELKIYLKRKVESNSIFHIHGVWMHPQYIASKISLKNKGPYILTPHGMFEPWLWEQGYYKKKFYFDLITKRNFCKANLIHAITESERNNLYKIFPKEIKIEVIPNLISTSIIPEIVDSNKKDKYILFLGRIHSKKGINLLLEAFNNLKQTQFKLKIAGPDSEYKNELIQYVNKLHLNNTVEFVGMVKGREKFELYKNAHVFVAPSYSEVIGMVNLEAAIMATPVITTHQTGLLKEWDDEGGILINPNIFELETALRNALSWDEHERNDRGQKLKAFVEKNYSWERNGYKWKDLYSSLLE